MAENESAGAVNPRAQGAPGDHPPAVDFDRLREITANDEDLHREISTQYLEQAEEILKQMRELIRSADHVHVRGLAHKLVGSSTTCGMTAIIAPLRAMEQLEESQAGEYEALLQESEKQLLRIRNSLEMQTGEE